MKTCIKHGELTKDQIRSYTRNRRGRSEIVLGCKLCHRATAAQARNKNREKANAWGREDRKKYPEKYREYYKHYKKKNWQKLSVAESLRFFGLTNEQYKGMVEKQENKCAICSTQETRKSRTKGETCRLAIDHCHDTNKVRGLLCHNCNTGIGKFKDDEDLMMKAILYLRTHKQAA